MLSMNINVELSKHKLTAEPFYFNLREQKKTTNRKKLM